MRYHEFAESAQKPMTPDEARLEALKKSKEAALNAEKMERERQKQKRGVEMQIDAKKTLQQIGKV